MYSMDQPIKKTVRVLGIIPARGGSKSIPRKNVALVLGQPLIYYTIRSAKRSKLLDAFVVSTDDEGIAQVCRDLGADVPFLRPKEFSRDDSPDLEFMRHALEWLDRERGWQPEIIVNLRPTGPLRTGEDIDRVVGLMLATGCDSVRTISRPLHNPFKMWRIGEINAKMQPLLPTEYFATLGTDVPRQLLPQNVYWQNGLVDATRASFIRQGIIYGPDIRGVITDPRKSVDIDDPEDLLEAAKRLEDFGMA